MLKYFIVAFVAYFIFELRLRLTTSKLETKEVISLVPVDDSPTFRLQQLDGKSYAFESIEKVLKSSGLVKVEVNLTSTKINDWDLLWSFEFFSFIPISYSALKYYQRLNHFPGISSLVSKSVLASTTKSKYVP